MILVSFCYFLICILLYTRRLWQGLVPKCIWWSLNSIGQVVFVRQVLASVSPFLIAFAAIL